MTLNLNAEISEQNFKTSLHTNYEKYIYKSIFSKIYGTDKSRQWLIDFQMKNTIVNNF